MKRELLAVVTGFAPPLLTEFKIGLVQIMCGVVTFLIVDALKRYRDKKAKK